ncbi:TIGR01458 family HAD-type hydrolase [Thermomicrobium sp. 4228-Ro]|uniref:TIGR01458 family HAD-type hydrolase n=1 Tax=Thermomicrobium sp. 4228-Ro TaxID=2993937 RepID=UPI0022499562|nr:TIGR01458 family HAD-type hydrolase [Thermomicrobium sp. 4228-Ro]MCX2727738.1 TIGR01458 family HAD-type hydrolase [Thermomicrobium sp. 4228-Ro]
MSRPPIKGLLIDVDGVLHIDGQPIPGAVRALAALRARGIPFVLLTNTTIRTRRQLGHLLRELGFPVADDEIVTAGAATATYLRKHYPDEPCFLLVEGDVREEFAGIPLVEDDSATVVVFGGAGPAYTYDRLNQAFRLLLRGAHFVAMHRNLVWERRDGLALDAGAFLLGLEAAVGRSPHVVGKPSPDFFRAGLARLGLPPEQVAMIGDSLNADVLPAQALGMTGILVRTGRFRPQDLERGQPDVSLASIADLPGWLETVGKH